jgi:hypothetical protein
MDISVDGRPRDSSGRVLLKEKFVNAADAIRRHSFFIVSPCEGQGNHHMNIHFKYGMTYGLA